MRYIAAGILILSVSPLQADELEDICQRMLEWRKAISSLECEMSYTQQTLRKGPSEPTTYKARWVETPNKIYRRIERAGAIDEYVWEDGVQKALFDSQSKAQSESGSIGAISKDMVSMEIGSPWIWVYLSRSGRPCPPLPKFLSGVRPQPTTARTVFEGRPCVRVAFRHPISNGPYEWTIDAENGLLLAESVSFSADRQNRIERSVENVSEVAPGIVFPGRVRQRYFEHGKQVEATTITFTKVVVNPPVDPDTLRVSFAPNTPVLDNSKRIVYRTDEHERPAPGSVEPIRLSRDQLDELEGARPWYRRWNVWLGICGGILILSCALAYWRRLVTSR